MKTSSIRITALAAIAAAGLFAGNASAESQYGSGAAGSTITAQARVNLSVVVPKLILLRVGASGGTIDTVSWTSAFSVSTAPTTPLASTNNTAATWDGTAPTATSSPTSNIVPVYAWTNSSGGGNLSYTATAFGAGGPTLGNVTVSAGAGLAHPTPTALAAASTGSITFPTATVATGTWTYALGGTPATWQAGTYTSVVTYTATSI